MKKESLPSTRSYTTDRINEENESNLSSEDSIPLRKNTLPYLPPSADIPCTCLYGSSGNIIFMKPLCPFHG